MAIIKNTVYITLSNNTTITIPQSYLASIEGTFSFEFTPTQEFTLGISPPTTARIRLVKPKSGQFSALTTLLARSYNWRMLQITITAQINSGSEKTVFSGLTFERSEDMTSVSFTCRGSLDLLNITKIQTPLFRNRKVATKIADVPNGSSNAAIYTLLKAENPQIADGASVGVLNAILWLVGGRPYKYKKLYDDQYTEVAGQYPKFYYDCDNSIINPEWVWFNYDNLYSDIAQLCKASGGMLKQDTDGIVRYKNVYSFRETWNNITLTDSNLVSVSLSDIGTEPYAKIITTFTPRYLTGSQEIYKQNLSEFIQDGNSTSKEVQFSRPVFSLLNKTTSGQLSDNIVNNTLSQVKDYISALDVKGAKRVVYAQVTPYSGMYINKFVASGELGNFIKVQNTNVVPSQSVTLNITNSGLVDAPTLFIADVSLFGRSLEASKTENYIKICNPYPTISGFKELTLMMVKQSLHMTLISIIRIIRLFVKYSTVLSNFQWIRIFICQRQFR